MGKEKEKRLGNWHSDIPVVVYRGTCAFNPCPLCGGLKKKTAKLCRTCRESYTKTHFEHLGDYSRNNPHDRPGIIYKITNTSNGKVYVGKTSIGLARRWQQHTTNAKNGQSKYFYRAIRKYGLGAFVIEVIDQGSSDCELSAKEIKWIAELESGVPEKGYNCTVGGDGRIHLPSSRARLKGVRTASLETRAKLRAINLGRKMPQSAVEKVANALRGRKHSAEIVAKRAEGIRRRWERDTELHIRAGQAQRARWTPEMRIVHGAKQRSCWTPEKRVAHSESQSRRWTAEMRADWGSTQKVKWAQSKAAEAKRKCGSASKTWWDQHPEAKERMRNRVWSKESRAKSRLAAMKGWLARKKVG